MKSNKKLLTWVSLTLIVITFLSCSTGSMKLERKVYYQSSGYFFSYEANNYFIPMKEITNDTMVTPDILAGKNAYKLEYGCGIDALRTFSPSFNIKRRFEFQNGEIFDESGTCHLLFCTLSFRKMQSQVSDKKEVFKFVFKDKIYSFQSNLFKEVVLTIDSDDLPKGI